LATSLQLPADVEGLTAEQVIAFALDEFPGRVSLACSFQKEETVLLDMLFALEPKARVFALDTHDLFPETYELWREVEKRYGTKIEVFEGPSLGRQAAVHGDELWKSKPDLCCSIRKIEPLNRALADAADFGQVFERAEIPVSGSVVDDALREGGSDAGQRFQLFKGGAIDVDKRGSAGIGRL
jgi:3''-phosphoadenosine 5''-phosphosulfate sulfotransferase (PAPS reductase)/FAD synthetase and related enzymes